MPRTIFFIAALLLLAGTLGSGWLHGQLTGQAGGAAPLKAAAVSLSGSLPPQLGPWRLVKTEQIDKSVAEVLQCAGSLHGMYTNDQTGEAVRVAVLAGPSGPISVHTPEICYSAQDYELAGEREAISFTDRDGGQHQLWDLHANARQATKSNLRVLYGWSQGDGWQATARPRFAFAGVPVLYKLQLSGPPRNADADDQTDPCRDFLSRFVAQLQPRLVRSDRIPFLANHLAN